MKRLALLICSVALLSLNITGQTVYRNQTTMGYYMPKTVIAVDINYALVEKQPGIFYQYAERYLAQKDVITESSEQYEITDITLRTLTIADTSRFVRLTEKMLGTMSLSLTEDMRLIAINSATPVPTCTNDQENKHADCKSNARKEQVELIPFTEEQILSNSKTKMAESTAKQIYRLRENRMNLLYGEIENAPADGKALELTLGELNKQEQQLCKLFIGESKTTNFRQTIYFLPQTDNTGEVVIARFSHEFGLVNSDDLSGEPIYLATKASVRNYEKAEKESKQLPDAVYYNLNGTADFKVYDMQKQYDSITSAVAQFGISVPISPILLKNKAQIYFSQTTGNIINIIEK